MRAQILSMGEAVVDVLPAGHDLWRPVAGGSSYNVALALGRLGACAGFIGRVSRDAQGERMVEALKREGVDIALCARDERPSPLSLVSAGTETTSARYAIYLDGTAHAPPDLPAGWLDKATHLHVSSFSAVAGAWGEATAAALAAARPRISTSFDVNVRPDLLPPAPKALALIERRLALVDLVKASDEDLAWLCPDRAPEETARAWSERYSCTVVLTLGARGATIFRGAKKIHRAAFRVQVADTVGAGDAFIAAFLTCALDAGGLRGAALDEAALTIALDFANSAAALCCTRHGADPASRARIEAFRNSL